MTIKEKYLSINQSNLTDEQVIFLKKIKDLTNDFETTDNTVLTKAEMALDKIIKVINLKQPEALKQEKKNEKIQTKNKKTVKRSVTKKNKKPTIFSKAKEIRKDGESWESAKERARKLINGEKENVAKVMNTELQSLLALVRRRKELKSKYAKKSFELGGSFMNTDLAGHTSGGNKGFGINMPLDGFSGTHYSGLVGETGSMSSGELFESGGGLPIGSEQPYVITESFGNPAQHFDNGGELEKIEEFNGYNYGIWYNPKKGYSVNSGKFGIFKNDENYFDNIYQAKQYAQEKIKEIVIENQKRKLAINKKVQTLANRENYTIDDLGEKEYDKIITQALVESLTDANFHREAKEIVSKLKKSKDSNIVYNSIYFKPSNEVGEFARKISALCQYDGGDIIRAYYFITKKQGSKIANILNDLFLKNEKFFNGGSLPYMTDPNFGDFQNTTMFDDGGKLKEIIIETYDDEIDLNDDNIIRAKMTQKGRSTPIEFAEKFNPGSFEYIDKKSLGGGLDYYEQLAVYVQGEGSIYNGTSMKKAINKAKMYLKSNPNAELVIVDEKYGDEYDLNGELKED